jgi:hypothetical protein
VVPQRYKEEKTHGQEGKKFPMCILRKKLHGKGVPVKAKDPCQLNPLLRLDAAGGQRRAGKEGKEMGNDQQTEGNYSQYEKFISEQPWLIDYVGTDESQSKQPHIKMAVK